MIRMVSMETHQERHTRSYIKDTACRAKQFERALTHGLLRSQSTLFIGVDKQFKSLTELYYCHKC